MASYNVDELENARYEATLTDEDAAPITLASVSTLTLTLYDVATGGIINSRNGQDVLNTNNVTLHATSGLLTWSIQALDNPIVTSTLSFERHRALFVATLTNGTIGRHEVDLVVNNLGKVP